MKKYNVYARFNNEELVLNTNDINSVLKFADHQSNVNCAEVDVVDGCTGEVYVSINQGENDYVTDEWVYILTGYLLTK
jgi:hypothetical protein